MAGVGQMRTRKPRQSTIKAVEIRGNVRMAQKFCQRLHEQMHTPGPVEQREYDDILPAIEQMRQLVILGDPGSGKTTTLWRIAADYAEHAKQNAGPLPVFVRLGELKAGQTVDEHIRAQLGALADHYEALRRDKRLALLLDGLNELPSDNRAALAAEIKALVEQGQKQDMVVAVTCRELDYTGPLALDIEERVTIEPLDPVRILQFVNGYLKEPPDAGETLFWQLAGDDARQRWEFFQKKFGDHPAVFWLADHLPEGQKWGYENRTWDRWQRERQLPRSMLTLARNPYMLYMMTQVFTEEGHIPPNKGALFGLFVDFVLKERERLGDDEAETLKTRLADLGYEMQAQGEGTSFDLAEALRYLGNEESLYQAKSANILMGNDQVRFTHQLLQEYFAARRLDVEMQKGTPATRFWPPDRWWEPQGWEETAILLAGLYSDDCTRVIEWLREANPELTARCVLESGAVTPDDTRLALREPWLPRLTDVENEPEPRARAAIGRGLGVLRLDNRRGVGLDSDGLPDIDWVKIPAGEFLFGSDKAKDADAYVDETPQRTVHLSTFYIARYPVTWLQFQAFIDAPDGYNSDEWWQGLAQREAAPYDAAWPISNHPRENVSWYQSIAFCRWLSAKLGYKITLPTAQQWEKAARGTDGRIYPWGNDYISGYANINETWQDAGPYYLGRTTAAGMYPQGASPYGVLDMSGNVWEWCLTEYDSRDHIDISNTNTRVVRGGSWYFSHRYARAAIRHYNTPDGRVNNLGFRPARSF